MKYIPQKHAERQPARHAEFDDLDDLVSHVLEEARMVLPGIQALLGFQLVAVFNNGFAERLSTTDQYIHLGAILLSINAVCFLLTPPALHRICQPDKISIEFVRTSSKFIRLGMLPLLLTTVLDLYVVSHLVTHDMTISLILALVVLAQFSYFWLIFPHRRARQLRGRWSDINVPLC